MAWEAGLGLGGLGEDRSLGRVSGEGRIMNTHIGQFRAGDSCVYDAIPLSVAIKVSAITMRSFCQLLGFGVAEATVFLECRFGLAQTSVSMGLHSGSAATSYRQFGPAKELTQDHGLANVS